MQYREITLCYETHTKHKVATLYAHNKILSVKLGGTQSSQ